MVKIYVSMSLLKFFKPLKKKPDLLDPNGLMSSTVPSFAISSANTKVIEALKTIEESKKAYSWPIFVTNFSSEI